MEHREYFVHWCWQYHICEVHVLLFKNKSENTETVIGYTLKKNSRKFMKNPSTNKDNENIIYEPGYVKKVRTF